MSQSAAMLWTGGKDSALALHEALDAGAHVSCLVTFAPPNPDFLAHPIPVMQQQAHSLGLPHHMLIVEEPFAQGYETALRSLRETMNIDTVVTGDIAEVNGQPNWIRERAAAVGMHVHTPLWGRDRNALLEAMLARGFRILMSCVDTRRLDAAWVGRELDAAAVAELRRLAAQEGIDACGENGEYHTLVLDTPRFRQAVEIACPVTARSGQLAYVRF